MEKNVDIRGHDLPRRLSELRQRAHLTKAELAARAGLAFRTIHDVEKGKRHHVQEKTLQLLAAALGMGYDELLNGAPQPAAPGAPPRTNDAPPKPRRRAKWTAAALAVAAATLIVAATPGLRSFFVRSSARNTLAVAYFENLAREDDPGNLGRIVANLLIADLTESRYVSVVPAQRLRDLVRGRERDSMVLDPNTWAQLAVEAGADWVLRGTILQETPNYVIASQLIDLGSFEAIASQHVSGEPGEELFAVVDRLTYEVRRDLLPRSIVVREKDLPLSEVTTHSLDAYRAYVQGLDYLDSIYRDEARESFRKAVRYDSTFAMAYSMLTHPFIVKDLPESRALIARALRYSDRASPRERLLIRARHARLNDTQEKAIEAYARVVAAYPGEREAYLELGRLYQGKSEFENAIRSYKAAITINPQDGMAYNRLAYSYEAIHDIEKAEWAVNQYVRLAPDEANPYDTRGDIYARSGRHDEAILSYQIALEKKPGFFPAMQNLGHMYVFKRDYARARRYYRQLLGTNDEAARGRGRLFLACIPAFQGHLREALENLHKGTGADQLEGVASDTYFWKTFCAAMIYAELGDMARAMTEVREMIEAVRRMRPIALPDWLDDYVFFLARNGDFGEAERVLEELETETQSKGAPMGLYWASRGWIEMGKGNMEAACGHFEKATETVQLFCVRYPLALAYLGAGRTDEATALLEYIVRGFADDQSRYPIWSVKAHYYLGLSYERTGKTDKAAREYEEFLSIWKTADWECEDMRDARRRLSAL